MGQAGREVVASSVVASGAVPWAVEVGSKGRHGWRQKGAASTGGTKWGFKPLVAGLPRGLLWAEQGGSPTSLAKSQNLPQLITWLSN